jgi:transcription-repair coupling factor (superfamily II helicase)
VSGEKLMEVALGSPLMPLVKRRLDAGDVLSLNSVADAGLAFVVALLSRLSHRPLLVVTDGLKSQEAVFNDLQMFLPDALFYPAWETLPHEDALPHADTIADRLRVLSRPAAPAIVTSVQALMQRTFSAAAFDALCFPVAVGQSLERDALVARLIEGGYSPEHQVGERGDMAVRGGIVDLFPLDRDEPVRIELFGEQIESIRAFDPLTQHSRGKLDRVTVIPAGEAALLKKSPRNAAALVDVLARETALVLVEPDNLLLAAGEYARQVPAEHPLFVAWPHTLNSGLTTVHVTEAIAPQETPSHVNLRIGSLEAFRPVGVTAPGPEIAERSRRAFFEQVQRWQQEGWTLQVCCSTEGELQRFGELWQEQFGAPLPGTIGAAQATLARGLIWPEVKLAVITDAEVFGRYKLQRPRRKFQALTQPAEWTELNEGDFVVHVQHGIGKYLGLKTIEVSGARQEVLAIGYANDARLYVPVEQAHLVSRYIGAGKRIPSLHELGGMLWQRQKFHAERAIMDLAAELLEIQAARATLEGHAFGPDAPWQREFEAAFPYDETPDQAASIGEVKRDMESKKPMDRLLCGDVGYGKTEVAIRAAFKAVMDGCQAAVLCPTTVLAEQHWNTFRERMAGYPITVEMLSRFRAPGQQRKIIQRLREGGVDIVIGTHRLLSGDVQFKNLGLVVIDEEQRFGVMHKERFKQLRRLVDVLTLTATPIPRTLYLSLTGARDMSTIQTPPQDRLPVETIIAPYDERLIQQAIQRELNRGGQVFFLHNRVQSIDAVAERLRALFADGQSKIQNSKSRIVIDVAHGQMNEHELESVMHRFVRGDVDVLVCTTIIESGLDIPNANTIIIDRADRFGLADLYQLRGRVGRWKHQAYAYILLPRHLQLVHSARKRISAIRQHSSLGSGFRIAMRDLEIRGAGNVLGAEQSGHITAVGFDLYCQLLKESIARLKGDKVKKHPSVTLKLDFLQAGDAESSATESLARIPASYITDARLRIEAYRKIARAGELADIESLRAELRDRFGPLPRPVTLLLRCAEVRLLAALAGMDSVETRDDKIMLSRQGVFFQVDSRFPRLTRHTPEGRLTEIKTLLHCLAAARETAR